jgi:hypothetical protein
MKKRLLTLAIGALAIPVLGGAAYAAAHSVSDTPSPQVVIAPANTASHSSRGHATTTSDDHGVDPTTSSTVDDNGHDGVGHVAGDDNGVDPTTSSTVDDNGHDGAGHDAGDDNGVDPTTSTTVDDSGHDGPGSGGGDDNSGKGSTTRGPGGGDDSGHSGSDG